MPPLPHRVREYLHAGKTCAVCLRTIKPGQRTVRWKDQRAHRDCVIYRPKRV